MIDGESSKAELLQSSKSSSGDITAVILTFTWSKSLKIWHQKQQLKLITLKELWLDKHSKLSTRDRRHEEIEWETGLTAEFDHVDHLEEIHVSNMIQQDL